MATIALGKCQCIGTVDGGPPLRMTFPEAASLTAVRGEPVYLLNGYVTECGDNPTAILGILEEDGHNSTAGAYEVSVVLADPRNVFEANFVSAAATVVATAQSHVGKPKDIFRDTTNSMLQVGNSQANARVIIGKLSPKDAVGDSGGRVQFRFQEKWFQLIGSS